MQSRDGGWGAFDADNDKHYLNHIPFADHGALLDPSTADVTARCVSFLAQISHPADTPSDAARHHVAAARAVAGWQLVWALGPPTTSTAPGRCCRALNAAGIVA